VMKPMPTSVGMGPVYHLATLSFGTSCAVYTRVLLWERLHEGDGFGSLAAISGASTRGPGVIFEGLARAESSDFNAIVKEICAGGRRSALRLRLARAQGLRVVLVSQR
jgi:hypothetical protein